jgi:hypothetical protein
MRRASDPGRENGGSANGLRGGPGVHASLAPFAHDPRPDRRWRIATGIAAAPLVLGGTRA